MKNPNFTNLYFKCQFTQVLEMKQCERFISRGYNMARRELRVSLYLVRCDAFLMSALYRRDNGTVHSEKSPAYRDIPSSDTRPYL